MLHVKQDESQFVYFGHTLIEKQPRMDGVLFIGLDRSKAQENGLARAFPVSRFLPCTKHLRDNVNSNLASLQLTQTGNHERHFWRRQANGEGFN